MIGRLELLLDVGIVSLLLTCSSWGRFQELELKIIYLSLTLFFPPKVLIYSDRTVVFHMPGQDVCFYRKCLHVALGLVSRALWARFLCRPSYLALHG